MVRCRNARYINLDHIAGLKHLTGNLLASEQRYFIAVEVYCSITCSGFCLKYGNSDRFVLKSSPLCYKLFTLYLFQTLLYYLLCRLRRNSSEMVRIKLYRYNIAVLKLSSCIRLSLLHRDLICAVLNFLDNFLLYSYIKLALFDIDIELDILASGIFLLYCNNQRCLYLVYKHSGIYPFFLCKQCQSLKKLRCVAVSHF